MSHVGQAHAESDHLRDVNQALVQQCQMYKLAAEQLEIDQLQHIPSDIRTALATMQKALHTVTLQRDKLQAELLEARNKIKQLESQLATSFVQPVRRVREKRSGIQELTEEIR